MKTLNIKTNSWETTLCGLGAILVALGNALVAQFDGAEATVADWGLLVSVLLAGAGLLRARDNNKSSEDVGISQRPLRIQRAARAPRVRANTAAAVAPLAVGVGLLTASLALALPLMLATGCRAVAPGHDPVVVHAERLARTALEVMDAYVTVEQQHRDALWQVTPEFKKVADRIRLHGLRWVEDVDRLTEAYKQNKTESTELALHTAVAVLQTAVTEAQQYLALSANTLPGAKRSQS